jgi:hypothetical protein
LAEAVPFSMFYLDRSKDKPPDDQVYRVFLNLHSYDKTELKPAVEKIDDTTSQDWKRERITFQAAYGSERVIADLYLPKKAAPPFQAIQYFSGTEIYFFKALGASTFRIVEFMLRSGRALLGASARRRRCGR